MNSLSPLSESQQKLLDYLRANYRRPEFAAARRQQWHHLFKMLDDYAEFVQRKHLEAQGYQYLATGLQLAGGGFLTEEQIKASDILSAAQKQDCLQLVRTHHQAQRGPELLRQAKEGPESIKTRIAEPPN